MVFVKVRETYDLHTVANKISVIGIHTPGSGLIKRNYPGLLMQCKAYRPVSCNVAVACASMLPADPLQVGTSSGDIAPEDLFNPILYKACNNIGMSQVEARIQSYLNNSSVATPTTNGESAFCDNTNLSNLGDEFDLYYGMLSDTNQWRHANPQSGLEMSDLRPLVYEMYFSNGDNSVDGVGPNTANMGSSVFAAPDNEATRVTVAPRTFRGRAHEMPMINCTSYSVYSVEAGFDGTGSVFPNNHETDVPSPLVYVGCIIVPPSRLHQLFYRMVVEWTLEFSTIRSFQEITDWSGLAQIGAAQHFQSYDYSTTSKAAGVEASTMENDTATVSTNAEIKKVM